MMQTKRDILNDPGATLTTADMTDRTASYTMREVRVEGGREMTREEAARVLKYLWIEQDENAKSMQQLTKRFFERQEALRIGVAALRSPTPDPKTGLVPCGCGGKAFVYCPVGMTDVFVIRCEKCRVGITFAMDLPRAKNEWNTAMGWKGGAE